MKIYLSINGFWAVFFVVLHTACGTGSPESPVHKVLPTQEIAQGTSQETITKEQAISIAKADAQKSYQSLQLFKIRACERARLWVIIYDNGGPEYYIGKKSGTIASVWKLPQHLNEDTGTTDLSSRNGIEQIDAIEIARNHFVDFLESQGDAKDHVNDYDAVACELENAWRVFFEDRAAPGQNLATLPNSNPPNYYIEKRSGKIMFTTHQIAKLDEEP